MTYRLFKRLWMTTLALGLASSIANADQTFVCSDGSLVTVTFKDLEEMKRTNACVASYFPNHKKNKVEGAVEIVTKQATSNETKSTKVLKLRPTKAADKLVKPKTRQAQLSRSAELRQQEVLPNSSETVDYRNVVIINARPGQPSIFRHEH